mmetsp:Transcript_81445/g.248837  ORF Transcript_81445/g.248837 Transcript_81445/m.248837 type:complete len:201 (+) Transcript_81445:228-830(+)
MQNVAGILHNPVPKGDDRRAHCKSNCSRGEGRTQPIGPKTSIRHIRGPRWAPNPKRASHDPARLRAGTPGITSRAPTRGHWRTGTILRPAPPRQCRLREPPKTRCWNRCRPRRSGRPGQRCRSSLRANAAIQHLLRAFAARLPATQPPVQPPTADAAPSFPRASPRGRHPWGRELALAPSVRRTCLEDASTPSRTTNGPG